MDVSQLIASLSDIATSINAEQDTDTILRQLIRAACHHLNWYRGTIMSIDLASGYAYVTVRYDPALVPNDGATNWALATSPSLVALRYNEPVFIPNAKTSAEFPGFQRESIEKDYSSVLVTPMACTDLLGRPIVLTLVSREIKELKQDDLSLIKLIVQLGTAALEKQKHILAQKTAAEQKEEVLGRHIQWMNQALSDDSVRNLAATIDPIFKQPLLVVDWTTNTILPSKSPDPRFYDDEEWRHYVESELGDRILTLASESLAGGATANVDFHYTKGTQTATAVARMHGLTVDGKAVGALIFIGDEEIPEIDLLLIESAKQALSVQLMRNQIRFQFEQRSLDALFIELIEGSWKSENDIAQRSLKFGIRTGARHRLLYVSYINADAIRSQVRDGILRGLSFLAEHFEPRAVVIARQNGIVVWLPEPEAPSPAYLKTVTAKIMQEVMRHHRDMPTIAISDPCERLSDYALQFERLSCVMDIALSLAKRGVVSASMLGPLSMLLVTADLQQIRTHINASLGPIILHDREHDTKFYETLSSFVDAGYRNQQCADQLAIHVTTLRYRLSRIVDLFGLDLESSQKRFEFELALRISKLLDE
ncbi:helix-turn-helix domain-containing protein [Shinella sp. CPCC 100929]|uniref:Helix-turn-helix domain-containing protein n=1 Tax=Shinella lacus TaxID=2654216 RepID=A0ABT1RBX1_9HYPH|nr:helix-turn-helix domain-containing protein [Shinella lacus]MCQ4632501.1 helix-turn-helix domain-containing protein [Shinella lacus]